MAYEFLRAIANDEVNTSGLTEATFKEYKKEYDDVRREGFSRGDAAKFSIAVNAYRDDLRTKQAIEQREKDRIKAEKEAKKAAKHKKNEDSSDTDEDLDDNVN